MPQNRPTRPVRTVALLGLAAVTMSGCSLFRPAPQPDLAASFAATSGEIAVERERFAFALEETRPIAPDQPPARALQVAEADRNAVPILVIGTPGQRLGREDHGSTRRLAQFLCAERPDWPRAGASASATRDWMEDGRWHIVNPCPAPAATDTVAQAEPALPLSPFTAPEALMDPIMSTSSVRLSWPGRE